MIMVAWRGKTTESKDQGHSKKHVQWKAQSSFTTEQAVRMVDGWIDAPTPIKGLRLDGTRSRGGTNTCADTRESVYCLCTSSRQHTHTKRHGCAFESMFRCRDSSVCKGVAFCRKPASRPRGKESSVGFVAFCKLLHCFSDCSTLQDIRALLRCGVLLQAGSEWTLHPWTSDLRSSGYSHGLVRPHMRRVCDTCECSVSFE